MGLNKKEPTATGLLQQLNESSKKPYEKLTYDNLKEKITQAMFPDQAAIDAYNKCTVTLSGGYFSPGKYVTDRDSWYDKPELSTEDLTNQMLDALDDLEGVIRG